MTATQSAAAAETDAPATTPILTIEGPRATIRLNRPRYRNRVQPEDLVALSEMFQRVEDDDSLRVLVLTGTGKVFSAGFHLGDIAKRHGDSAAASDEVASNHTFEAVADQLENLRLPTICQLNGGVYGGSTDLALACDFRLGGDNIEMFMPAARIGVHYYKTGLSRYVSRLGMATAKRLFLTAEKLDAEEMLRVGYLDKLVPAADLPATVDALADTLASMAPLSISGMKRTINELAHGTADLDVVNARRKAAADSADAKEGVAAFFEKRKPVFKGK